METTNNLKYTTSKVTKGNLIEVKIRLNDECKNGNEDFAITGTLYNGPSRNEYNCIAGGCIHDEILEAYPKFKTFVDLHLCDFQGMPMHPTANGYYHLRNGFNEVKPDHSSFKKAYCEYYRITPEQFDELSSAVNEVHFGILLKKLNITKQWKVQADKAIEQLEQLTGEKFKSTATKTHWYLTEEKIAEHNKKVADGYFSEEAIQSRERETFEKEAQKIHDEFIKETEKSKLVRYVKYAVLQAGGKDALDNCIFHSHIKKLIFNWKSYDRISQKFYDEIVSKIQLPEGVTITKNN